MIRNWLTEFGTDYAVPVEILALVERGILIDESWHNDTCPRFTLRDAPWISLYVEHPDPTQRETGSDTSRFAFVDGPDGEYVVEMEDVADVIANMVQFITEEAK